MGGIASDLPGPPFWLHACVMAEGFVSWCDSPQVDCALGVETSCPVSDFLCVLCGARVCWGEQCRAP